MMLPNSNTIYKQVVEVVEQVVVVLLKALLQVGGRYTSIWKIDVVDM